MLVGHEAGDAVEGVGNHLHPLREGDQQLAPIGNLLAGKADLQLLEGFGVQFQPDAERRGGCLPGMVVRRVADTAAGKDHIASRHRALEGCCQTLAVVTQVFHPGQAQAARAEHFGNFGEVLVLPLAGQNLVANDDGAKGAAHKRSPSIVTSAPPRERRRASSP